MAGGGSRQRRRTRREKERIADEVSRRLLLQNTAEASPPEIMEEARTKQASVTGLVEVGRSPHEMFRETLSHPVLPIVTGAALTISGSSGFSIRSACLFFIAMWTIYDTVLYSRKRKWKGFATAVCLLLILVATLGVIAWWRAELLTEVQRQLHIEVSIPQSGDAEDSIFSVRNGSDVTIGKHNVKCDFPFYRSNITLVGPGFYSQGQQFEASLPPDQAHATQCLLVFNRVPMECTDMTVSVTYNLAVWPRSIWSEQKKVSRFYGHRSNGGFVWQEEPTDARVNLCEQTKQP
jgi:hypothetical protein